MFLDVLPAGNRCGGEYRGTADAVQRNRRMLEGNSSDHVLILSGDHVYRADYRRLLAAHLERDADVTLLSAKVAARDASLFGVLVLSPRGVVLDFVEKPSNPWPYARSGGCSVNTGVYVFEKAFLLEALQADSTRDSSHDFGKDILPEAVRHARVVACPLRELAPDGNVYWRDVGTVDALFEAQMDLLHEPPLFRLDDPRWPENSAFRRWLPEDHAGRCRVRGAELIGRNLISPTARAEGACLRNCILGPETRVGRGATLEECILHPGGRVGPGVRLRRALVDEGAVVSGASPAMRSEGAATPGGVRVLSSR